MDLAQLLARLRSTSAAFSTRQLVVIAGAFVLVVGGTIGASYLSAPGYRLLFDDMEPAAASEVVEKLKAAKIPYQIDAGGRAIRVPEDRVDEMRLTLTAQGLPSSGRIGFEIFDRTAFGETEFLEHVNYRRALEGEIARTITTIGEVASARVHIAMAKDSLFASKEQPAKASIIVKLKGRQPLSPATVAGMASLVASSVEGLRPENVVILDNFGRSLTRPAETEEAVGFGLERQQRIERDLAGRVVSLLEPIVGTGRVRVNVAARLNAEAREETEERYDPTTVIRSHQMNNDTQQSGSVSNGAAGARANLAPPAPVTTGTAPAAQPPAAPGAANTTLAAAAPGAAAAPAPATPAPTLITQPMSSTSRNAETTNYEVSRLVRHSTRPRGELARLWVAVLVDDDVQVKPGQGGATERTQQPRTPAELQKIQGLVAAAVGLDQERGDQLTVENISFDASPAQEGTDAAPLPPSSSPSRTLWVALGVGGVLIALIVIGVGARMLTGQKKTTALPAPAAAGALKTDLPPTAVLPRTVQDLQNEIEAQLNAEVDSATGPQRLPALARRVGALASKEPEAVALLVRSWMTEDRR